MLDRAKPHFSSSILLQKRREVLRTIKHIELVVLAWERIRIVTRVDPEDILDQHRSSLRPVQSVTVDILVLSNSLQQLLL